MLVFIDESGIHKESGHSVFALVYVIMQDYPRFEQDFIRIEKELKIRSFHWKTTTWAVREKFFDRLLALDFEVKIGVAENPIHPEKEFERMLLHMLVENKVRSIYVDGEKPKQYANRIKKVLRDKNVSVKKLRTIRDEQCAGVRVADAMAGLARAYFDEKPSLKVKSWYARFRRKKIIYVMQ